MGKAALKPSEKPDAAKRAKPANSRAKEKVQRKRKTIKDEQEDRKSALLGGGVQPKLVAQRMAAEKEPAVQAKRFVQRKASDEEPAVQAKLCAQRKAEEEDATVQAKRMAQRQATEEEATAQAKPLVQRQASEEEPLVQAKAFVQRQAANEEEPTVQAKRIVQRMTLEEADIDETKKLNDTGTGVKIQKAGFVSSPEDASEREADRVADSVVNSNGAEVQRVTTGVQRKEQSSSGGDANDKDVEARIKAAAVGGKPLSKKTRALLEPRFGADFAAVRIHDDAQAAQLSTRIGARAFAYGKHIFFNEGQYQPDTAAGQHLLAHELTHTIQQRATIQRKAAGGAKVGERTGPQASRLGVSDALDFFADAAYNIPGYRMFTILLGVNPINMREVERSAANILRAIVEFLPGGRLITAVLDLYNVFEDVGAWVEEQMDTLDISGASIRASINEFLDSLSWSDIFDLDGVWERAKRIFTDPIDRILTFIGGLFDKILEFVQQAVLAPLAALVEPTEGYGLLKQILGFDPITGEEVERDVGVIIGGLLKLAGQEELWNNIQEANALERIGEWFFTAIDSLIALVVSIPDRFVEAFQTIEITEFMDLPGAIAKVLGVFAGIVIDFGAWILDTVFTLLRIIVEVVAPGVIPYLEKAGKAFDTIINDPIGFVGNLVAAAKRGFQLFFENFIPNLRSALIQWLTGAMSGANIHIPQAFTLKEILKFVLSVLGLTWENIRPKLVRVLGETAVVALETGFELVTTLVTEGPAAAWQQIVEMIGNLRDMVIEQIISFVTNKVIEQAVIKLVSFLNPAGALIQAIIAIYNTVMFFVERLTQIAQVAAAFIDSIADIAAGKIDGAAKKVEQTMVGLLSLVISFLARLVGLGNVAKSITNLIDKLRKPIDKAIDKLIAWIVKKAKAFFAKAKAGVASLVNWWKKKKKFKTKSGQSHSLYFKGKDKKAKLWMASTPKSFEDVLNDQELDIQNRAELKAEHNQITNDITSGAPGSAAKEKERKAFQAKIAARVDALAGKLSTWLDHDADLPPTTVTWAGASGGRSKSIRAEPLTKNPGNTKGSPASGNPSHAAGYALMKRWDQPTTGRTGIDQTRITGCHLLNGDLHGPYTEAWNIALADQALNNKMTPHEAAVKTAVDAGEKVKYEVSMKYHNNKVPPPEAMTLKNEDDIGKVQSWIGYYGAIEAKMVAKAWDKKKNSYSKKVVSATVTSSLPPVKGQAAVNVNQVIVDALKASAGRVGEQPVKMQDTTYLRTDFTGRRPLHAAVEAQKVTMRQVSSELSKLTGSGEILKSGRYYYIRSDM